MTKPNLILPGGNFRKVVHADVEKKAAEFTEHLNLLIGKVPPAVVLRAIQNASGAISKSFPGELRADIGVAIVGALFANMLADWVVQVNAPDVPSMPQLDWRVLGSENYLLPMLHLAVKARREQKQAESAVELLVRPEGSA